MVRVRVLLKKNVIPIMKARYNMVTLAGRLGYVGQLLAPIRRCCRSFDNWLQGRHLCRSGRAVRIAPFPLHLRLPGRASAGFEVNGLKSMLTPYILNSTTYECELPSTLRYSDAPPVVIIHDSCHL